MMIMMMMMKHLDWILDVMCVDDVEKDAAHQNKRDFLGLVSLCSK